MINSHVLGLNGLNGWADLSLSLMALVLMSEMTLLAVIWSYQWLYHSVFTKS